MTGMQYYALRACDDQLANHHRLSTFPSNYSQKMNDDDNEAFLFPQHHSKPYQNQWQPITKLQQSSWFNPFTWQINKKQRKNGGKSNIIIFIFANISYLHIIFDLHILACVSCISIGLVIRISPSKWHANNDGGQMENG